jgi:hypothetical protein
MNVLDAIRTRRSVRSYAAKPIPAEVMERMRQGRCLPTPIPIRARDQRQPQIEILRRHYLGDPRLPIIEISVRLAA